VLVQPTINAAVVAAGTDRVTATPLLATWARVVSVTLPKLFRAILYFQCRRSHAALGDQEHQEP
jgi:hypothetical protein